MLTANRRRNLQLFFVLFLVGAATATYLYWPALTQYDVYTSDIRQSPHWAAYHTTSFQDDNLILEYARYNESPLQNAIYFIGTWFFDLIPLNKILSVVSYGLATCLFFFLGRAMYDERTGFLAAMFFTFFPHTFEFSAGFFSKFWMIPCLLVCMYLLHRRRFRGLILLMPFATVAYPMTSLLIGMICGVYAVMLLFLDREAGRSLFRWLAAGSAIAVLLLSIKYASPPEFIGPMMPRGELLQHMYDHDSPYYPIPSLFEELALRLGHPFIVVSAIGYLLILRRRVHWEHSWTALLLASSIGYVLADLLFIQLYIPNRYTRYSIVVFLALWNATNWARILSGIRSPALRRVTLALLILFAGVSFRSTFDNTDNMTESGMKYGQLCGFIRLLPEKILLAGPPRYMDEIMLRSRRSVLIPFKLNHEWYTGYQSELRERTMAVFRAIYASDVAPINELHTRYGVTHLVVGRSYFEVKLHGKGLESRYDPEVRAQIIANRTDFLLEHPPRESVIYNDGSFALLKLPLPPS